MHQLPSAPTIPPKAPTNLVHVVLSLCCGEVGRDPMSPPELAGNPPGFRMRIWSFDQIRRHENKHGVGKIAACFSN